MKVKKVIINYPTEDKREEVENIYLNKLAEILSRKIKSDEELEAFKKVFMRAEITF